MFALSETYAMQFHSLAKQNLTHFSEAGVFSNHSYIVFNRNATKRARKNIEHKNIAKNERRNHGLVIGFACQKRECLKLTVKLVIKTWHLGSQN